MTRLSSDTRFQLQPNQLTAVGRPRVPKVANRQATQVTFCVRGVLSPLLSNIMLHEFDAWLEAKYLSDKARKDRWAWNFGIKLAALLRFERTGNGSRRLLTADTLTTLS